MKNDFLEPYLKENNLLQLSLFYFGKTRPTPKRTEMSWEDDNGNYALSCDCYYGVPSGFEQDVYTACMRIWVRKGMPKEEICLNYSDVARELCLDPPKAWVTKIKNSLKKLAHARYEFQSCFIKVEDGIRTKSSTHFSLFDKASLFQYECNKKKGKRNSQSKLLFPYDLRKNIEAKYYQYLDMAWYRALPQGLPRRLYEYLAKRKYHNKDGVFIISEEAICRWLPIKDKHTTNRRKTLAKTAQALIDANYLKTYVFDKKKKQCSFEYNTNAKPTKNGEIEEKCVSPNQNQDVFDVFVECLNWLEGIPRLQKKFKFAIVDLGADIVSRNYQYIRKEYENISAESRVKPSWIYDQFMKNSGKVDQVFLESENKLFPKSTSEQLDMFEEGFNTNDEQLNELFGLIRLQRVPKAMKKLLCNFVRENGFNYVKDNILYANKNAKKSYCSYLSRALAENWGAMWVEEQQIKEEFTKDKKKKLEEEERIKLEEEKRVAEKTAELIKQREVFKEKVESGIPEMGRKMFWDKAEERISEDTPGRSMNVKIEYARLLLEAFNNDGAEFLEEVVSGFDFIKEIAKI